LKVVYLGRPGRRQAVPPELAGDVLELLTNNWDDYGYGTTFQTTCRIGERPIELGIIKVLVEGHKATSPLLDSLRRNGWNGEFPAPLSNYISVPGEITFYEQLLALLGPDAAIDVARALRDASYLVNVEHDDRAIGLMKTDGFRISLQRERGAVKSFLDGWKVFASQAMAVMDLGFRFRDVFNQVSTLKLKFQSTGILPHDINVLIGPNGSGKSRVLHQIVSHWSADEDKEHLQVGFVEKPNLSQIVVVSYSPFERFPVDLQGHKRQDQDVYRYFGFRGRSTPTTPDRLGQIKLTHETPKRNAALSLIACLTDDKRYRALQSWAQKLKTAERVLRSAFEFDFAAIAVEATGEPDRYYNNASLVEPLAIHMESDGTTARYIPITSDRIEDLNEQALSEFVSASDGVVFFRGGQPIKLSSGQRLFSFVVINILGVIRRDSLILIDEPELFLHPSLEIQFIDLLKQILAQFNSKALLATHSVVTVREVPAACVHVFQRTDDGLVIKHPPFQTFGADMQRISSYVFGDQSVSKPFERWIKHKLQDSDPETLIEQLGDELNEELVIQIRAMGRSGWS
jgi:predicted ATPase